MNFLLKNKMLTNSSTDGYMDFLPTAFVNKEFPGQGTCDPALIFRGSRSHAFRAHPGYNFDCLPRPANL